MTRPARTPVFSETGHPLVKPLKRLIKQHVPRSRIDRVLLTFPMLYPALRYESQLSPAQLAHLHRILGEPGRGNVIECGVYRAGTTVLMAQFLKRHNIPRKIYALDSFGGFDVEHEVEQEIRSGSVVTEARTAFTSNSADYVRAKLRVLGVDDVIEIVPGFFQTTLPRIQDRFRLALIDCDLEESTAFCLQQLWDRVVDGGYIVVDDYTNPGYPGAAAAADRFCERVRVRERIAKDNFLILKK